MSRAFCFLLPFTLLPILPAQDMVAVGWGGEIYALDSHRATLSQIGTGLFGQNATAIGDRGTVWSTHRSGSSPNWVYSLTSVDPKTATATVVYTSAFDVRGLAPAGPGKLWCIVNGNPDVFYAVDTGTGAFTRIGSTGSRGMTGLALHEGRLFAWNLSVGLMTIDSTTGRATDVNPRIGAEGGSEVQFLASRSDGKLVGGKNDLFEIDPATGAYTLLGKLGTATDLRGAEEWFGNTQSFGTGCAAVFGPTSLGVTGTLRPAGDVVASSDSHAANAIGAMVIGGSRSSYLNLSLPLGLDSLLGTQGCSLYVSFDFLLGGVTSGQGTLTFKLGLPSFVAGLDLHLQHFVFEAVPGGTSWSNGVTVNIGY